MSYPFHPLADIFPLIEGDEFSMLVASIQASGQREAIVLHDGQVLDGRNRQRACEAAKVEARYEEFSGDNPLAFVIDKNLRRRHLDESQRAMAAAKLATMNHGGDRKPKDQAANLPLEDEKPNVSQSQAAILLNVSPRLVRAAKAVTERAGPDLRHAVEQGKVAVSMAEHISRLPEARQNAVVAAVADKGLPAARSALKKEARIVKEKVLAGIQTALPNKKYGVILADPEWKHAPWSESGMAKSADNHYPTTPTDDICARPVQQIAHDDCVLFLWGTVPMLPDALRVMAAWGFTYRSHAMWRKKYRGEQQGMGYWFRINHEILLVGTRGKIPCPAPGENWGSVYESEPAGHSVKPDWQYELIEHYFPNLPKIELNARRTREGWDRWGLEAPIDAAGEVKEPQLEPSPG